MKKLLFFAFVLLAACSSKAADGYVVEGTLKGFGSGKIYVNYEKFNGNVADSIEVVNDRFTYKNSTDHPVFLWLIMNDNKPCEKYNAYALFLFVENSDKPIIVKADVTKAFKDLSVENSVSDKQYRQLMDLGIEKEMARAKSSLRRLSEAGVSQIQLDSAKMEVDRITQESLNTLMGVDFFNKSVAASYFFQNNFACLPLDQFATVLEKFDTTLNNSVYISNMKDHVRRSKAMKEGNIAPNFLLKDVNGKAYTLADFKGKTVLLDFTASWCGWCKKEIPYIENIYKSVDPEKVQIISVYLDKKQEDWIRDTQQSSHPWLSLSDMKDWQTGGVAYNYNVGGIPMLVVISPEGKIISAGTRGDETLTVIKNSLK